MVYEFPELQGIMGYYFAKEDGLSDSVANACSTHYAPLGPMDNVPNDLVSISVALADKIDTITNFWAINEKPTGSKDPYALRRTAIGIIRILIENKLKVSINKLLRLGKNTTNLENLEEFLGDRLRVLLRDKGIRVDVLNACFAQNHDGIYCDLEQQALVVQDFVNTSEGSNLIQAYKRAVNILKSEELKDGVEYSLEPKLNIMIDNSEIKLFEKLNDVERFIRVDLKLRNIEAVMINLANLKEPIDHFFDNVQVNDVSPMIRRNRLCLLNKIKVVMHEVAVFSIIDG
jgi:glycyl-tRNA synthetase beta chain